ncbi:MAG: UDP-2,3-diacylglucosamine diphosphatase [Xanthomonadales bacterium]|nr:UDP-2,3-diacylglucosamine diphosphatase [Xanthomonadales bacterium]MCC6560992.1 UDP-2,3-diacylglucosamine diphosphatase [Xanthomonadales bacterium]
MTMLFISDLHLDESRPQVTRLFLDWLQREATGAEALYILGDLFETYIGDDDDAELVADVAAALRAVSDRGVDIGFVHGNRDFLIGDAFALHAGLRLLPETRVIDLYGERTLLLHGDTLCSSDLAYQGVRKQLRDPVWQEQFLAQPLAARRAFAAAARAESARHTSQASEMIMDVDASAVTAALTQLGATRMIHGHTHRPAIHELGGGRQRIVLGDWYEQGSLLHVDRTSLALQQLPMV